MPPYGPLVQARLPSRGRAKIESGEAYFPALLKNIKLNAPTTTNPATPR